MINPDFWVRILRLLGELNSSPRIPQLLSSGVRVNPASFAPKPLHYSESEIMAWSYKVVFIVL